MKFPITTTLALACATAIRAQFVWERLDKTNAVVVIVDIQEGLRNVVRDFDPVTYRNAILAHAEFSNMFDLPLLITTASEDGANGPAVPEFLELVPNATVIPRAGEINAYDNANFVTALEATGKKHVIVAGILTDVCTTFLSLSLKEAGYSVWANVEASGTTSELIRNVSNDMMRTAGVNVVSFLHIFSDLMRSWANKPGFVELMPYLDKYYPVYGNVARLFNAASNTTA